MSQQQRKPLRGRTRLRKRHLKNVEVWLCVGKAPPFLAGRAATLRGVRQIFKRYPKARSITLHGTKSALNQLDTHTNGWGPKLDFTAFAIPVHCETQAESPLRKATFQPKEVSRFWSKVDTSKGPDACWPWKGRIFKGRDMRGAFDIGPDWLFAHRCAYFLEHSQWPEPQANHTCDNSMCCNPKHIYAGTSLQNAQDRDNRHRRRAPSREEAGRAKLTEAAISEIRRVYKTSGRGSRTGATALAKRFGVHRHTIQLVGKGKTWVDYE